MVEDVCPLPGTGQNLPLPLLLPLRFRSRMISSMVVNAPHGEVAKSLPVARLATHKLLKSVDALVPLELLATTLADKHIATMLPNLVLVRRWQRLESLVTDITGMNPLSLYCAWYPTQIPSSNNMNSPTNPPLTSAGVLLEADPHLEGDVADGKADPPACYQLGQLYVLQ